MESQVKGCALVFSNQEHPDFLWVGLNGYELPKYVKYQRDLKMVYPKTVLLIRVLNITPYVRV